VKKDKLIDICTIEDVALRYGNNLWVQCLEPGKQKKEVCELSNVETWTEKGWTKLFRVIRHKLASHKKMVRIVTQTGLVDVTDDHSLLLPDAREISPTDAQIGTELLHSQCIIEKKCCEWLSSIPYFKHYYELESRVQLFLRWLKARAYFELLAFKREDEDIDKMTNQIYVPAFTNAYPHPQALLAEIYLCATQVFNFHVEIVNDDDYESLIINPNRVSVIENGDKIIQKEEIPFQGYVYDLTTENHHFAAGIGKIIVHNTDSVFFTFNLQTPQGEPIRGKKALEITIELAQEAGHLASAFLKGPHDLEYEKTFMPFCLLSKKRYVGMLYETDPEKCKRKEMGICLKRRDSAPIVKDIYGGVIDILMKEQNIQKAIEFLKQSLQDLVDERVPMDKLIITKSLRSGYKNPKAIAHKVLADRIAARDPGNKPTSGDRIPFVYTVSSNKKALQGEKIETPSFVIEQGVKIDYAFYITNQIMKPVQQLFALVLERIWIMQRKELTALRPFKKEVELLRKSIPDDEKFNDKLEQLRNKKVKAMLFDDYLRETNNEKEGNQSLMRFFKK
jgi:hypothetical protein